MRTGNYSTRLNRQFRQNGAILVYLENDTKASMRERYTWYECSYPGTSSTFYVNVKTGVAHRDLPEDDPDAALAKEFPVDVDICDDFPFYIS